MPELPTNLPTDLKPAAKDTGAKTTRAGGANAGGEAMWLLALLAQTMVGESLSPQVSTAIAPDGSAKGPQSVADRAAGSASADTAAGGKGLPPTGSAMPQALLEVAGARQSRQPTRLGAAGRGSGPMPGLHSPGLAVVDAHGGENNPVTPVSQVNAQWLRAVLEAIAQRNPAHGDHSRTPAADRSGPGSDIAVLRLLPPGPAAGPPAATAQPPGPSALQSLPAPSDPGFGSAVESRVAWMVGKGIEHASIEVHPRDLGPVTIRVHLSAHGADVSMHAAHPDTRQALMAAAPRLGELFAAAGLVLNETRVWDPSARRSAAVKARPVDGGDHAELSSIDADSWRAGLFDQFV